MAASATNMKTKKTFGQWFKSRKVQQWLVIVSFMIVPVLLLLVFSYVPFAKMFEFSLYKMKSYDSKTIHMWDLKIILMYLQEMTVLTH